VKFLVTFFIFQKRPFFNIAVLLGSKYVRALMLEDMVFFRSEGYFFACFLLSLNQDSDFIIDLSVLHLRLRTTLWETQRGVVGLAKPKVSEPKWLTSDIKKVFNYKVRALPGGLRLTKLTSKRKKP